MERERFVEEMTVIKEGLIELLAAGDEEQQEKINILFEDLIKQADEIKESDEERLPDAFVAMGHWLGPNYHYHSTLSSTRNLFIDYIELDLTKT